MRTTITIPDPYYLKVKEIYQAEGYSTVNSYLLALLRHQFDDIKEIKTSSTENKKAQTITVQMKGKELCKHGYLRNLCKHQECHT
jgi:hypothetical protein